MVDRTLTRKGRAVLWIGQAAIYQIIWGSYFLFDHAHKTGNSGMALGVILVLVGMMGAMLASIGRIRAYAGAPPLGGGDGPADS